ncbi:ABC transporter substrate-binding protein [Candidatus Dependentiae bacterium]|nr:ABC transporter substrate-binding protein [Candidatus Dependentiae bacterium]
MNSIKKTPLFVCIGVLLCSIAKIDLYAFTTLTDLVHYATTQPEYPESNDAGTPYFTSFHQKMPPWWRSMLPYRHTVWDVSSFNRLLSDYLQATSNHTNNENIVITAKSNDTLVVFGNVHGALHSLARDLQQLKQLGFINDHFELIKSDLYLIFNGNTIDLSAYSLEVLCVILKLLLVNPQRVFYLRGKHEDKEFWVNSTLGQDLKVRASHLSREFIPLKTPLKKLFEQLPKALVIRDTTTKSHLVISALTHDISTAQRIEQHSTLQALITDHHMINNLDLGMPSRGLYLLSVPNNTPAQWALVSSPVAMYRMKHNFHYDSFALLTTGTGLPDSTLMHYYHDTRQPSKPFVQGPTFAAATGKRLSQMPDDTEHEKITLALCGAKTEDNIIYIGSTMDFSRALATQCKNLQLGITLCIDEENKQGGIHGKMIKPIFMDDQFDAQQARANVQKFMQEYKSTIFLCPTGSPTLDAYTDLITSTSIMVFFPITGAGKFRNPRLKNIVHWRISYQDECNAITRYMLDHYKPHTIDFFYQNDLFGKSLLEGALQALENRNQQHRAYSFEPKNLVLDKIVQDIVQQSPQVLGIFCASNPALELIRNVPASILKTIHLYGMSVINDIVFRKQLQERGYSITVGHAMPVPHVSTWPMIKEYKRLIDAKNVPSDPFIQEGYMSAVLMVEILRRVQGPLTHHAILQAIESLKNYSYKGMTLTFNAATNEIAHYLWIETETGEVISINGDHHVPQK